MLRNAVDEGVSNPFGSEQKQSEDGESDLEALGVELLRRHRLHPPLGRRFVAQAQHFSDDIQIDDRADKGENHHRNSDGILVEAAGWGVYSCGRGESRKADGDAQAADGNDGGAGALENGKDEAGPVGK